MNGNISNLKIGNGNCCHHSDGYYPNNTNNNSNSNNVDKPHCCYCTLHRQKYQHPYAFYQDHSDQHRNTDDNNDAIKCGCCNCDDLDQFAAGTTCYGICNSSWSWYRRACWLVLVLLSLSLLATQLHDRWATFLKFELKTEVAIESSRNLTLPSVTLCNANFFSRRAFTPLDSDLFENLTYTIAGDIENDIAELGKAGAILPDNWTMTYWQAAMEYELLERQILQKYNETGNFSIDNWLRRIGWQLTKIPSPIIQCRVGRSACSAEDFKPVLTPQGLCYTLTNSPVRYVQQAPGGLAGINLFLDIHQEDYTKYNFEGHVMQFECGIKVILHEWYERPDIGQSVGIPPGMSGFVSIKRHKRIISAEEPWSDCIAKSENANLPYSEKECLNECNAKQTLIDCGCRLWYEPGNATICGVARTTACLLFKELVSEDPSEDELRCKAKCLEACHVTSYSASVSYTSLASSGTLHELTTELVSATHDNRFTEDYIRTNVIALQIAFAQLVTDRTISTPALTLSAFLSDIGGQLGLFAGISLITICKLIEYPLAKLVDVITSATGLKKLSSRTKRRNLCQDCLKRTKTRTISSGNNKNPPSDEHDDDLKFYKINSATLIANSNDSSNSADISPQQAPFYWQLQQFDDIDKASA